MGQYKMAVFLGVRASDVPALLRGDDGEGLLDAYDTTQQRTRDASGILRPWHAIVETAEPPAPMVGVCLAISADDVPGARVVGWEPVDLRELMCSPDADAAYRAWGGFVAWCAGRGVELPVARVWLVMMEVA
jgi:hypothetical protein